MSRLCDRIMRRASPGLDADLSGLGLSFLYPGNVRKRRPTPPFCSFSWPEHTIFPEGACAKDSCATILDSGLVHSRWEYRT